uniref:DUF5641 domain-containing protein n=1 Tax=Anopheles minimus TaxID=112268 RepID=A0A182VYN4_9DIPT
MLSGAGFPLRKWVSNVPAVLSEVDDEDLALPDASNLGEMCSVKALGLLWRPCTDDISVDIKQPLKGESLTRRTIYSEIARLFDPLGILAPVILWAKILMQQLWICTSGWDDPVGKDIEAKWNLFVDQFSAIKDVSVPRFVLQAGQRRVQLHCFSDASESAYGACLYVRSENDDGQIKVALIAAKSKVAPLKRVSLAKLELCGALLAAKLWQTVCRAWRVPVTSSFFWTDSTVVLCWLRSPSYVWATFVANRVAEVQEICKGNPWMHVKGTENPADMVSRGKLPQELAENTCWFGGPPWLAASEESWNLTTVITESEEAHQEKKKSMMLAAVETSAEPHLLLDKFSSYWKTVRVAAYCLRYIRMRLGKEYERGVCSNKEFRDAVKILVKTLQQRLAMHAGPQQTLAFVRQEFWILNGKAVAKAQMVQNHWTRWQKEYLGELHNSYQKNRTACLLRKDQMVMLKEEDMVSGTWSLGRIIDVHPGRDGVVRVITVRTKRGNYKRPASK